LKVKDKMDAVVSVVIPCRNEKDYIQNCLNSVLESDYSGPIEVLLIDGMSDDGTREIVHRMQKTDARIKLLDNPRKNTPQALNIGLESASGAAILILGAHSDLTTNYISSMAKLLFSEADIGCVGGRTIPVVEGSAVQVAIGDVQQSYFGVGNSYYMMPGDHTREVDTVAYGLYRKEAVAQIGLFNTELIRNQDIEFNSRLRHAGYRIILDHRVFLYYHPRVTLRSFCRQSYGNGFWNIKTWQETPGSLSWRHFVPLAFFLSLAIGLIGSIWSPVFRVLLLFMLVPYTLLSLAETVRFMRQRKRLDAIVTFLVFPILHVSYGFGSFRGLLAHLRERFRKLPTHG